MLLLSLSMKLPRHFRRSQMVSLHADRYPYSHDADTIKNNFIDFSSADDDFDPICLKGKHWELIKLDIIKESQLL